MSDLILRTGSHFVWPLLTLFSISLLLQGHDAPGGGFAGGLVGAAGAALHALTHGVADARRLLWISPRRLFHAGLLLALLSGFPALAAGDPYMASRWVELDFGQAGSMALGTPLLFDLGVYLAVVGVVVTMIFAFLEEEA